MPHQGRSHSKHQNLTQELKKTDGDNLKRRTEEMETKVIASVLALVEKSGALKIEDVLQHRLIIECLSIFNANGTMLKVQKSKLQEKLTMTAVEEPDVYTSIVDMGLIWCLAAPTPEDRKKGDGTKYTSGDYADKVVCSVIKRHKHAERIICINGTYDQNYTIKDSEKDDEFPAIKDFHVLLGNPGNKINLQLFLQTAFHKFAEKTNIEIIYVVVCNSAKNLTTGKLMPEYACSHAEADTAMFTIYNSIRLNGYKKAAILDTEDTDNYVQAAYVGQKISGLLCVKKKGQIITARCLSMKKRLHPLYQCMCSQDVTIIQVSME